MSLSSGNVTLVQETSATMNFKHKKCLQTLICAVVIAYFMLVVYQTFGSVEVTPRHSKAQPFYIDRNLAEDRSQTDLDVPEELTSEFATATATVKPPSTTLDDVFISVKTTEKYHTKRLLIILKTWFQLARKQTWFFTDTDDTEFQLKTNMCSKEIPNPAALYLNCDDFGSFTDHCKQKKTVKRFTWTNSSKIEIQVMNYGACITSIKVPDRKMIINDVVLGFPKFEDYLSPNNPYLGCTVGRVANRIAKGKMKIDGKEYTLAVNNGPNHLHGGNRGFDKVVWDYSFVGNKLTFSYLSADMEEGYPGALVVNVSFELTNDNEFIINYKAMTTKPTIVNLTNHTYFNLAGDHTGAEELYKHQVFINAKKVTEVNDDLIPTGALVNVADTAFDFRTSKVLGDVINKVPNSPGFDHNFCLEPCGGYQKIAARVKHPDSGRVLEVYTDQPGIQFYTGNFLANDDSVMGKNGKVKKHGAFCMETQKFPDAVNQPKFPSTLLYPGETYETTTIFKFLVE